MKTLLFLLNSQKNARTSILLAIQLAKILNSALKIIHISFPKPLTPPGIAVDLEMFYATPNEYVDIKTSEQIDKELSKLKLENLVDESVIIEHQIGVTLLVLKKKFEASEFDYLAMYEEKNNGPLGSPTIPISIIRNIDCPTWIIPSNFSLEKFKSIVYATDYQKADIAAVQKLLDIFSSNIITEISFIHLTENLDFDQELLSMGFENLIKEKTQFNNTRCYPYAIEAKGNISDIVNNITIEKNADLIVVLKENRNLLQKVFYRSFTEKLLHHIHIPLLVLHQ